MVSTVVLALIERDGPRMLLPVPADLNNLRLPVR